VGVLDKAVGLLDVLAERGPLGLGELPAATGLPRATAYRLAVALERHGLVLRDADGRFGLGLKLIGLGRAAGEGLPLRAAARPALEALRDRTGESVQLYVAAGGGRIAVESLESPHGLRWIVPVGMVLPLDRGSAGKVLSAGVSSAGESPEILQPMSWVESVEEREPGVASVSAPIRDRVGHVIAAVSVSGPVERLSRAPGARYGEAVVDAARHIETVVAGA
jgi:DNA-binding IclR family transcriptional regulator